MLEKYMNNDLNNPKYLFHGSSHLLSELEKRQSHDSDGTIENEDLAVFLTSSFIIASAHAFMDKIEKISSELNYDFEIGRDADSETLIINMNNVNVDDNMEGYIYVIPYDESYEHHGRSIQYKSHDNIKPIETIKIKFGDYKQFYNINRDVITKHI